MDVIKGIQQSRDDLKRAMEEAIVALEKGYPERNSRQEVATGLRKALREAYLVRG